MFAFLRGVVARKTTDGIELDVNGVGYQVFVPDLIKSHLEQGTTAVLLTYCHIREDAFQIFGFLREEERTLFRMLLGISGIGPKVALAVLSRMTVEEISRAIHDNDVQAFTRVNGIGKKGAQRIVLEMKSRLGQDAVLNAILGNADNAPDSPTGQDDVIEALCSLGCSLAEARKAAMAARKELGDDAPDEELVKSALRSLAKI